MKIYTKISAICLLLISGGVSAQNEWSGGASGKWDEAANWSLGHVPLASETAMFDITATVTVTGTNAVIPKGLIITSDVTDDSKAVILDGNFSIGNSRTPVSGGSIFIEANGKLVVSRALSVIIGTGNKSLIFLNGTLEVSGTVYLNAEGVQAGIDARHAGAFVRIKNGGSITIVAAGRGVSSWNEGGFTKAEDFVVDAGGTLEIVGGLYACMVLYHDYDFVNNGTVKATITVSTIHNWWSHLQRRYAILLRGSSFSNNAGAVFETIDRTPRSVGRSLRIYYSKTGGGNAVTNSGTMNLGGEMYHNILIEDGSMINNAGGYINFKGNQQLRIAHANAVFTNNGYFKKADATSNAIDANAGAVHNNAFLHTGTGVWPSGGSHTNNGVEVDVRGNYIVDAQGSGSFNVGIRAAHNWYDDNAQRASIGSNDAAGAVTLTPEMDCDYKFYSVYGDKVSMTVTNYDFGASCSGNEIIVSTTNGGTVALGGVTVGTSVVSFSPNQINEYRAVPDVGYNFVNWTFSNGTPTSTENPLTYTVARDETITANFVLLDFDITMETSGNGGVTLGYLGTTVNTAPVNYDANSVKEYHAVEGVGYRFAEWTFSNGTPTSTDNPLTYTVAKDETITVNFRSIIHTIIVSGIEGTVTPATGEYPEGVEQTFTATANEGAEFKFWLDAFSSTLIGVLPTITIIPTQDMELIALFEIPLGAEDLEKSISKVKVYPVPASSEGFQIDLKSMKGKGLIEVKIFSTQGQLVYDGQLRAVEGLFVQPDASWKAGLYLIRVANEEYKEVKRIAIR